MTFHISLPRHALTAVSLLLLASASGCDDGGTDVDLPVRYEVEVSGERFTVEVVTAAQVEALDARLASGQGGVINGSLAQGDGGYNQPWSWHLVPGTIEAPDMAIELCDGRPSMVEADLEYWLDTVERFCPWGARVMARIE